MDKSGISATRRQDLKVKIICHDLHHHLIAAGRHRRHRALAALTTAKAFGGDGMLDHGSRPTPRRTRPFYGCPGRRRNWDLYHR